MEIAVPVKLHIEVRASEIHLGASGLLWSVRNSE